MNNRTFAIILALIIIGFGATYVFKPHQKGNEKLVGVVTHKSQSGTHIAEGTKHAAYNSELPSSGPHYQNALAPAAWGVYVQELIPEIFVHNEEHGGVVIAYRPDLPADQIKKLQKLFAPPYSDASFEPVKAILTPRAANKQPIEMASWTKTYSLQSYDQQKIEKFYLANVASKLAPESFAGPNNKPVNQAQ